MNTKIAFAVVGLAALGGCIIEGTGGGGGGGGGGGPQPGDIVFTWTFDGGETCQQVPQVANVQVVIPGQTLAGADPNGPAGLYPCNFQGYDGVDLGQPPFTGGAYTFTLSGLDSSGDTLYSANGTVNVDGTVDATVDLSPTGFMPAGNGNAFVSWVVDAAADGGETCAAAGLSQLFIQFYDSNNNPVFSGNGNQVACADGSATLQVLSGNYTVVITGTDSSGTQYSSAANPGASVTVQSGGMPTSGCMAGSPGCVGQLSVNPL